MRMKAGSLKPAFQVVLESGGVPIDLTGATVSVRATQDGVQLFNDVAPTIDAPNGKVTHTWVSPQTDTVGRIFLTATMTQPDAKPVKFPPLGEFTVDVE